MQVGRIQGATRVLGDARYLSLPIRDCMLLGEGPAKPCMESAWFPTPRELEALLAGAPIIVRLLGIAHPPIMVSVGERPLEG